MFIYYHISSYLTENNHQDQENSIDTQYNLIHRLH